MTKSAPAILLAVVSVAVTTAAQDRPVRPERPSSPAPPPAPVAPVPPVAPVAPVAPRAPSRRADEGHMRWGWSDGWRQLRVSSRGRIELTDDERDVKSVSPNGYFEISSRGWLSLFGQRYIVRGNADGTTTRRFTVGSAERPLDAETRAWIGDTIQRLARSGFDVEGRVARILAREGPAGVLDANPRSSSAYVTAKYLRRVIPAA